MSVKQLLQCLIKDQRGAAAIEYGLICAFIVLAMLGALTGFAGESNQTWMHVASEVMRASNSAA